MSAIQLARSLRLRSALAVLVALSSACDDEKPHVDGAGDAGLPRLDAEPAPEPEEDASEPEADAADELDGDVDIDSGEDLDADVDGGDAAVDLFPADRIIEVAITVDPADWDTIRREGRSLNSVFVACADPNFDDYTKVHAEVTIDGHTFADVGIRKKGFLGSISVVKPSLRIDLDEFDKSLSLDGTTAFTLNNSKQDQSYTHQCMSFAAFEAAGIAAPRCSFSHVTVNGQSLGTYVNVEPIKRSFLEARFGDKSGNLYEGSSPADFRADMLVNFEQKTNESDGPGPELQGLADALLKDGDAMLTDVESRIDVDTFLKFWATETLVAHWDGYAGDLNNFLVYQNPTTEKLSFIPWGTDGAYQEHAFIPVAFVPKSVYAWSRLPNRLYNFPATRMRYQSTMRDLLADWDETALLAEIDRIAALVPDEDPAEIEAQRTFVSTRKADILGELDATTPAEWLVPERAASLCTPENSVPVTGTFDTTWGDVERAFVPGATNALALTLATGAVAPLALAASAGTSVTPRMPGPMVRLTSYTPTQTLVIQFALPGDPLVPGVHLLHGFESFGVVVDYTVPTAPVILGYIGDGSVTFTSVGTEPGAVVQGTFSAHLVAI